MSNNGPSLSAPTSAASFGSGSIVGTRRKRRWSCPEILDSSNNAEDGHGEHIRTTRIGKHLRLQIPTRAHPTHNRLYSAVSAKSDKSSSSALTFQTARTDPFHNFVSSTLQSSKRLRSETSIGRSNTVRFPTVVDKAHLLGSVRPGQGWNSSNCTLSGLPSSVLHQIFEFLDPCTATCTYFSSRSVLWCSLVDMRCYLSCS